MHVLISLTIISDFDEWTCSRDLNLLTSILADDYRAKQLLLNVPCGMRCKRNYIILVCYDQHLLFRFFLVRKMNELVSSKYFIVYFCNTLRYTIRLIEYEILIKKYVK